MELEVGQFVRTKDGEIHKIKSINDEYIEYENGFDIPYELKEYIVKASYNIIDILKVGDILVDNTNRKSEVLLIDDELMVRNTGLIYDNNYYLPIKSIAIKSVITHEKMEQMAYKVEE